MAVRRDVDDQLVLALASGRTAAEAAAMVNVNVRTVHRRRNEPEFAKRVEDTRREFVQHATARLSSITTRAADVLAELLESDDPNVQLRAARAVLEMSAKMTETNDLSERIRRLEEKSHESETPHRAFGIGLT